MSRFFSVLLVLTISVTTLQAERRIALVVDTSGSMAQRNDKPRYAVQISKILTDLVEDQDKLAIIRFPGAPAGGSRNILDIFRGLNSQLQQEDCNAPADRKLMVVLNGSQRATFKDQVDNLLEYEGPTHFGPPLRLATQFLGEEKGVQRMLLMLTDAEEGFGNCVDVYTAMLQHLRSIGIKVALVKIGAYAIDGFAGNPAIDFREDVRDSARLIDAVAQVYQRFLGSNKVQTGRVAGDITVKVDDHVKEAFLVIAAESPLGQLQARPGNPHADHVDLDYRSGGQTQGLDMRPRGYRIVRLTNPEGGSYTFSTPPGTSGGWMLIEDYAVTLQMITKTVPLDGNASVQIQVVDERTGKPITDNATLTGLKIEGNIEGDRISQGPDGSGTISVPHKFNQPGQVPVSLRLRGEAIDRTFDLSMDVVKNPPPRLESQTQNRADVGNGPTVQTPPTPATPPPPPLLTMAPNEISLGSGEPVNLGRLTVGNVANSELRLRNGHIDKAGEVEVTTDFEKRHAMLEIQTPNGWQSLSANAIRLPVNAGDTMRWPMRIRLEECPGMAKASDIYHVTFMARLTDGSERTQQVPVQAEIVPEPWYVCWRREILAVLLILAAGIVIHGFVSPSRFGRRAGVQVSAAEDLAEGFFYPFRAARGSRSGFYRDSRLFLSEDFRLTHQRRGGLVRLRADKTTVKIRPENGRPVWKQQADGSWEQLTSHETIVRPGVVYRNDSRSVYFDVRTK